MTREIEPGLAKALASGVTTLCRCWRLERRDGTVMGFTDHDRDLTFGGVTYEAGAGFARSEIERGLGMAVDNLEAAGALRSDAIREADVRAGVYDGAEIRLLLVDWTKPKRRHLLFAGHAGEIRRGKVGFEMEVLGVSERLNRPQGRVFQRLCDAGVGDARCGVVLEGAFAGSGAVTEVREARRVVVSGLDAQEAGWFDGGRLSWTSGPNAGTEAAVRRVVAEGALRVLELWAAPAHPAKAGDAFEVTAGCDKAAETCRTKFGNFERFRGFPLMPGEDWTTGYPRGGEAHDGGSLFGG